MKKNYSLKSSMIICFFTAIFFIIVISATTLLWFLNYNIINIEHEKLEASVKSSSKYLSLYLGDLKKDIELLSKTPKIQNFIYKNKSNDREELSKLINNIKQKDKNIKKISIITKDGENITTDSLKNKNMGTDMMEKKWYIDAMTEDIILNPTFEKKYSGMESWVLSLSKNIYKNDKQGVIILDLHYAGLYNYLTSINLGKNGEIFIIDDKNNIIYSKDIAKTKQNKERIMEMAAKKIGYDKTTGCIYFNTMIEGTNFKIIGVNSGDTIKTLKTNALKSIVFFSLILCLAVYLIVIFISKRLTVSLKELENKMQNISENLYNISLGKKTYRDIELLNQEINLMINRIKELKEYEIDSLYSQINPHFLYNTLDTLIWMIEFEDNDKAVKLTKNLAEFFRLSLSQGKRVIRLEDEVEHTKKYLEIQKERYAAKLNYEITFDEKLIDKLVPKIIIQPLVENAIYHGLKNIKESGRIKIIVRQEEDFILIDVIDNGIGIENAKKLKLKLGGVGLKNIDSRIKYYCGKSSGVFIDKNFENGSRLTLKLKEIQITDN